MIPPIPEPHGDDVRLPLPAHPRFSILNVVCALAMVLGTLVAGVTVYVLYAVGDLNFASPNDFRLLLMNPAFVTASVCALLGTYGLVGQMHRR